MHVLTVVANSTLLNYVRKNYRTVLRAGIVGMVTKDIEQSTVQRHGKEVGSIGAGGLTAVESDASFSNSVFFFYMMHKALW